MRDLERHFDADYYRRYYEDPHTAVVEAKTQHSEVAFVLAFCRLIELEIRRFADVGAGTGWWAREFSRQYSACRRVETFDASRTACELFSHRRCSVQELPGHPADLVVCRDVLRYVPDSQVTRAIRSLSRKCRGVLYLQVMTSDDNIDRKGSDMRGHFRSSGFYRRLLKNAGFANCGMGLFVSDRCASFNAYALEVR